MHPGGRHQRPVRLLVSLSIRLSVRLPLHLAVCLPACLSIACLWAYCTQSKPTCQHIADRHSLKIRPMEAPIAPANRTEASPSLLLFTIGFTQRVSAN